MIGWKVAHLLEEEDGGGVGAEADQGVRGEGGRVHRQARGHPRHALHLRHPHHQQHKTELEFPS